MKGKPREPEAKAYKLAYRPEMSAGFSPYRLVDADGGEVAEVNEFLDAQAVRELSVCSLRAYGYSLLNFWRWLSQDGKELSLLQSRDLDDYIRFQKSQPAKLNAEVAPKTINHRLSAVCCLYRFHRGCEIPGAKQSYRGRSHPFYNTVAAETGYLYPARPRPLQRRVKTPRRVVVPLTRDEVRAFLESLRTWRDLTITALMLFCGLRSREVIQLTLDDVRLVEGEIRVRGKGNKERVVPLAPQVSSLIQSYLEVERPRASTRRLFLCLKGKKRGQAMTPAGLRSLFRYHRGSSGVAKANPHRFRHTFGSEMARAGIRLPALMKLMGHAHIHTTMTYVEVSPNDIFEEFQRVIRSRKLPFEHD